MAEEHLVREGLDTTGSPLKIVHWLADEICHCGCSVHIWVLGLRWREMQVRGEKGAADTITFQKLNNLGEKEHPRSYRKMCEVGPIALPS